MVIEKDLKVLISDHITGAVYLCVNLLKGHSVNNIRQ